MRPLVACISIVAVHLVTAIAAWTKVGLLADDHHMIGGAILRHRGLWSLADAFWPPRIEAGAVALFRPFIDLVFWCEQPFFGIDPLGYHVVNSVFHCGTSVLWFVLLRRLGASALAAGAAATLFVGWAGHSEALHWIAARTNLQSTFLLSAALVMVQGAVVRAGLARTLVSALAGVFAVMAVGTKESAVFVVPLAFGVAWFAAGALPRDRSRFVTAMAAVAPLTIAVALWLWWRADRLGTWGSGTHYGWHRQRIDFDTCRDWWMVMLAPVHRGCAAGGWVPVLALAQGIGLVLALRAARRAGWSVVALGGCLLAMGYVAGIGLERLDLATLENVRYSYEPAIGLCAMVGFGLASLPRPVAWSSLLALLAVHGWVLAANATAWHRASAVYARMQGEVVATAHTTGRPLRVFDAPGIHDGAFAYLNGVTEFRFWQEMVARPGELRGGVASQVEWWQVLQELAASAAARQPLVDCHVVRWDDGSLQPFTLDTRWPQQPWPQVTIGYARLGRERPFAGSAMPVHVHLTSAAAAELRVEARAGDRVWSGAVVAAAAAPEARGVLLALPVPADVTDFTAELVVRVAAEERRFVLGDVHAVPR